MNLRDACAIFKQRNESSFDIAAQTVVDLATSSLSEDEIAELAIAVSESGEKLEVPPSLFPLADVPSTGGPASLSTLLCPLLIAAAGIRVPKLSATGSTAGAIDT